MDDDDRKYIEAMSKAKDLSKEICDHAEKIKGLLGQIDRLWAYEEAEEEAEEGVSPLGGKAK